MDEKIELALEIKKLSESIRNKNKALRLGISEREEYLETTFKPIVNPLNDISSKLDGKELTDRTKIENVPVDNKKEESQLITPSPDISLLNPEDLSSSSYVTSQEKDINLFNEDHYNNFRRENEKNLSILGEDIASKGVLTRKYIVKLLKDNPGSGRNYHVYGARLSKDGLMIGNSHITVGDKDDVHINGKSYKGTRGLFELIFKKVPTGYTQRDIKTFKQICNETNLHRKGYTKDANVHRNNTSKYKKIISALFPPKSRKLGNGLNFKNANTTNVFYYHDINDVVTRMQEIHDAMQAGHTGLDNEMEALTEVLKREKIIT